MKPTEWVDGKLGHQFVFIEGTDHVCPLQNREFRLHDLIVAPAGFLKFLFRDLEGIAQ